MLMREVLSDTVLTIPRRDDPNVLDSVPLRKGAEVVLDFISVGYDEETFPNSDAFNPFRWTRNSSRPNPSWDEEAQKRASKNEAPIPSTSVSASTLEGFIGFSFGPRTCLGHKFAKVEAVAFLTLLLREWRVEVYLGDMSKEEWKKKNMDPKIQIALAIGEVPVRLVKRCTS